MKGSKLKHWSLSLSLKTRAVHHVQGPPEHVMTPDGPNETLPEPVDDSLRSLVQAMDVLTLMCCIRSRALINSRTIRM